MAHRGFIKKISQRFEDEDRYFKGSKVEGFKKLKKRKKDKKRNSKNSE